MRKPNSSFTMGTKFLKEIFMQVLTVSYVMAVSNVCQPQRGKTQNKES